MFQSSYYMEYIGRLAGVPYLISGLLLAVVLITVGVFYRRNRGKSVARLLATLPETYTVFDDVSINSHMGLSQIAHVVVSRHGIFIICEKQITGEIFGKETDQYWTQTKDGDKNKFYNPIRQNYSHIKALEALLTPLSRLPFVSLVVFPDACRLRLSVSGVTHYRGLLAEINKHDKNILTAAEVSVIVSAIRMANLTDRSEIKKQPRSIQPDKVGQ